MWVLLLIAVGVVAACSSVSVAGGDAVIADLIPDQDGVRRYTLRSGLEVVMVPADEDAGANGSQNGSSDGIELWLVLRAGTMDEDDAQRGAAGVVERFVRQGLGGYDADAIDGLLAGGGELMGGRKPSGSMVLLDQTIYMGRAARDDLGGLESLLGMYAAMLRPQQWAFNDVRVSAAKSGAVEMVEGMMSPEMRARQHWLPELLGEGRLGTRVGLTEPEAIERLDAGTLASYARAYYTPSRATLLVVGGRDEAAAIERLIAQELGGLEPGQRGGVVDLREPFASDQGLTRSVAGLDPELEGHTAALVWITERDDACLAAWSECASAFTETRMRSMLIGQVADELIRHRIERLGVASLGRETKISVDQIGLAGQVDLLQCVIQRRDSADWESSLRLLIGECDRLARDGAGQDEIVRARGSLLARWHRAADEWRAQSSAQRVWLVHWLISSGRPMTDMVRWDQRATRMMSTIGEQEIRTAIRRKLDPSSVRVLAVARGEPADSLAMRAQIDAIVKYVRKEPLAAIDPDWMRTLGGALLDRSSFDGEVVQVSQHAPSGTWGGRLSSGLDVWARPTAGDDDGQVEYCATLWGGLFADGSLCEAQIEAAMLAWTTPSSESRSARWLAVYMQEHELGLETQRVVGGVQLRVQGPAGASREALELLYVLLDRPMIDAQAFERWASQRRVGEHLGKEPLERAMVMLYQPELASDQACVITLDDAQRLLTRMVRNAQIGVGIAGRIDPAAEIEQAGVLLGSLAERDGGPGSAGVDDVEGVIARERSVELATDDQGRDELVLGMMGSGMTDLEQLRASILAAMVLSDRAQALARARGLDGVRLDAQIMMSDAIGARWALVLRARGKSLGEGEAVFAEALSDLIAEGISDAELEGLQEDLDRSIGRYFDRAGYWSRRLSELGMHGRSVQDLWEIRSGYAAIDAERASEALRMVVNSQERFRVLVKGTGSR